MRDKTKPKAQSKYCCPCDKKSIIYLDKEVYIFTAKLESGTFPANINIS